MGTRHLVAVKIDGEYKVAQYGQWDGYPEGQGATVLRFLLEGDVEALKRNLARTYHPDDAERNRMWAEFGVEEGSRFVSIDASERFAKRYPSLHRNTGAGILELIAKAEGEDRIPLDLNLEFAGESLFCEYAYVIDFDTGTFEVFEGFNKAGPVPEGARFADLAYDENDCTGNKYYQVTLSKLWPLSDLPTPEDFLAAFEEPEEVADQAVGAAPPADANDTQERPVWSA